MPEDTKKLIEDIYSIAEERKIETLETAGDDDFSFSISNLGRFRISTYRQRGSLAAVIRLIAFQLPNPEELSIPSQIMQLAEYRKGLVLTILITHRKNISLHWKIRWNFSTVTKRAL